MPTVLIVGAGPTGLVLAHELARYGIQCRVIEKRADRPATSRAIAILPRTIEIFELMGVVDGFLSTGKPIRGINAYGEGKRLARIALDRLNTRYSFALALPQDDTERLIEQSLTRRNVMVERNAEMLALSQDQTGVVARVRFDRNRVDEIGCDYLIGCDGAHSTVRELLGMSFRGGRYSQTVLLADVRIEGHTGLNEAQVFLHPAGLTLLFPMAENRYRLIATDPRPEWGVEPMLDQCQSLIDGRGLSELHLTDAAWTSTFRIAHRRVAHFRMGRIFLAGDAAHIYSPMGAQGMNAGIQDAFNLGWKLAMVVSGSAQPGLLDSYESERMPIDTRIIRWTDRGTRLMFSHGSFVHSFLRKMLSSVTRFDFLQRRITNTASQIGTNYRESPIVEEHRLPLGPHAGDRAPDARIHSSSHGRESSLFDLFSQGRYTLLVLWDGSFQTRELRLNEDLCSTCNIADQSPTTADFIDAYGEVAIRYGIEPAVYLIRPDGHVAFRCRAAEATRFLPAYLERAVGRLKNIEQSEPHGPRAA